MRRCAGATSDLESAPAEPARSPTTDNKLTTPVKIIEASRVRDATNPSASCG